MSDRTAWHRQTRPHPAYKHIRCEIAQRLDPRHPCDIQRNEKDGNLLDTRRLTPYQFINHLHIATYRLTSKSIHLELHRLVEVTQIGQHLFCLNP